MSKMVVSLSHIIYLCMLLVCLCVFTDSLHHRVNVKRKQVNNPSWSSSTAGEPLIVSINDETSHDVWKLKDIVTLIQDGGVGIIPTDTCYSFVTSLSSRDGIQKLMSLINKNNKKPLSCLFKDQSMIAKYTIPRSDQEHQIYKTLKKCLPGPYTFILNSSKLVPKLTVLSNNHKLQRRWKSKEIGIRIPDDMICKEILQHLDEPLICVSVPTYYGEDCDDFTFINDVDFDDIDEEEDEYVEEIIASQIGDSGDHELLHGLLLNKKYIDFVVENGVRSGGFSTVVDLTDSSPVVIRLGKGDFDH